MSPEDRKKIEDELTREYQEAMQRAEGGSCIAKGIIFAVFIIFVGWMIYRYFK